MAEKEYDVRKLDPRYLKRLPPDQLRMVGAEILRISKEDMRENQLLWFKPVSKHAEKVIRSNAKVIGVGGGNRASKTDTVLAEVVMHATGVYPQPNDRLSQETIDILKAKFRGPVNVRIVIESLTTTLHPVILPKLQWWKWNGLPPQGGTKGHWGWVPKTSLRQNSWEKSWSEKLRQLVVVCKDPETGKAIGESSFQFMSFDQDPTDFASGEFHHIIHDEPPTYAIWTEDEARVMSVGGRLYLSMTWPDDPAIPVDWIYDRVYEPGRAGPNKDPNVEWFELATFDNPNVDQEAIDVQAGRWSDEMKRVRLLGQPIRFSNRVHPLFTDVDMYWCLSCKDQTYVGDGGVCSKCKTQNIISFNHVMDFSAQGWPTVFVLDPHPRKPHMMLWVQVDPSDDLWVIQERLIKGGPDEVRAVADEVERNLRLNVTLRLGDPNMLRSPSGATRGVLWLDEFAKVGMNITEADDSDVGRARVNDYLAVDPDIHKPRLVFHPSCETAIMQMKRYIWDDFKRSLDKDQKQKPKDRNDDFPTMLKYLLNYNPTFDVLNAGLGRKVRYR